MNKMAKITALFLVLCLISGSGFSDKTAQLCTAETKSLAPWVKPLSMGDFTDGVPVFRAEFTIKYTPETRMLYAFGRSLFFSFYYESYVHSGTRFSQMVEFKESLLWFILDTITVHAFGDVLTSQDSMNLFLLAYYIDGFERAAVRAGAVDDTARALSVYEYSDQMIQLFGEFRKVLSKKATLMFGPEWDSRMLWYFDLMFNELTSSVPHGKKGQMRKPFKSDRVKDIERYITFLIQWSREATARNDNEFYFLWPAFGRVASYCAPFRDEDVFAVAYQLEDKPDLTHIVMFNSNEESVRVVDSGKFVIRLEPGQVLVLGLGYEGEVDYVFNSLDIGQEKGSRNWNWFVSGPSLYETWVAA